jgi:hypothetical protein
MLLSEEGGKILRDSLHEVDFTSKDLKQILRNNIHYNVITNQVENSTLQAVISSLKGTETLDIGGKNISSIKNTLVEAFSSVSNELENDVINLSKLVKQEINENLESPLNKKNLICFNNRLCSINNVMENNNEYPFMNMNRISPQEVSTVY